MPGAMEGREDEHVAQPRVLKGQGSTDHTSLVFSRGFGQWEDAGVPLPLEWEEPALGDGGGRWWESFLESWRAGGGW